MSLQIPKSPDFSTIQALILDSDGVLTDGGVTISESGEHARRFDIKDGLGLVRLREAGFPIAIISASSVSAVLHRAKQLGIAHTYVGEKQKLQRARALVQDWNLSMQHVAYMGDDLADLEMMSEVGFPIAVADAVPPVLESAVYVTRKSGGHGAVREVCDQILEAHGHQPGFNPHAV